MKLIDIIGALLLIAFFSFPLFHASKGITTSIQKSTVLLSDIRAARIKTQGLLSRGGMETTVTFELGGMKYRIREE